MKETVEARLDTIRIPSIEDIQVTHLARHNLLNQEKETIRNTVLPLVVLHKVRFQI